MVGHASYRDGQSQGGHSGWPPGVSGLLALFAPTGVVAKFGDGGRGPYMPWVILAQTRGGAEPKRRID